MTSITPDHVLEAVREVRGRLPGPAAATGAAAGVQTTS
jgi:hypothetical protein